MEVILMVLSWTGAGATVTFPSQTEGNSQWEQLSALKRTEDLRRCEDTQSSVVGYMTFFN